MDQIEKGIIVMGSYFMLFVAAIALKVISDLPLFYDVITNLACIYIAWAREDILANHVLNATTQVHGGKFIGLISSIIRILIGVAIIKLMIMGFYQYVLILYLIDYFTWAQTGRALSHVISLYSIERISNES